MSLTASIRLSKEEEEDMMIHGFKSASEYLRWKIGKVTETELEERKDSLSGFIEKNDIKIIQPPKNEGMTKDDAIRMAKLEFELKLAQSENNNLRSQVQESLGAVSMTVSDEVNKLRKEEELINLRAQKINLEKELDEFKSKYKKAKKSLKKATDLKELAPIAQPLLGAIASGVAKMQTGGGFAGLLGGFADSLNAGPAKLTPEEENAMSLGKDIQAMFTQDEFGKIMTIISFLSTEKELIDQTPQVLSLVKKNFDAKRSMSVNDGNEV